jgi:hypothetical protein
LDGLYRQGTQAVVEALQGTLTLARTLYGDVDETPQVHTLMKAAQAAREQKHKAIPFSFYETVWQASGVMSRNSAWCHNGIFFPSGDLLWLTIRFAPGT